MKYDMHGARTLIRAADTLRGGVPAAGSSDPGIRLIPKIADTAIDHRLAEIPDRALAARILEAKAETVDGRKREALLRAARREEAKVAEAESWIMEHSSLKLVDGDVVPLRRRPPD